MSTTLPTVDGYGFERDSDFDYKTYAEFMEEYLRILTHRARRWEDLHVDRKGLKKSFKVKRFIRKGVPKEHRGKVWCLVSGANDLKAENPGVYRQLLESPHDDDIMESIDTDIPRTFPDNIYFRNDPEGKCKNLKNVLVAFAHYDKSVGYCQGLNFITGMLLLVTENEENAFWLLVCLVQHILPPGYYTSSMSGLLMDIEVFSLLLQIKDPEVSEQLKKHDVPLNLVASKWFICLYADVLPIETLLRLWDCLFYEGSKVLFRAALCLVMVNRERILAAKSFVEIVEIFKGIGRDIFPTYCHEFMKSIFLVPKSLPMKQIQELRLQCTQKPKNTQ